ncbi:BREX protein BrxB domain-containing protein [Rubrivirga litoralis]|uniref:DUF1788 domain-containing protein n=1 Tax=Rubrivirga litoralis TaxID=3075598 RepID=A0ABU3BQ75_9BACT|nr:BREX protein BrxB domain-containing protein [Rubrivirga sp. F394]MDT0631440.1 DUF1788 domain-containing protein [Rubrivirga sp. F394]
MTDAPWTDRLTGTLEPLLLQEDPRPDISAYADMPYAIFRYPPDAEFPVRQELARLRTRLENGGKRVTALSLAECLDAALKTVGYSWADLAGAEQGVGLEKAAETVHQILSDHVPLDGLVAARIPDDAAPTRDVVFVTRAGALFPFYRTSSLLDQLMGKVLVPAVLFYPGEVEPPAGLRFMGRLDAEHNYRPKIF